MTDKFLFIEDLKGVNGKIAQENAFEELEAILDDEVECDMCDEKDAEIDQLQSDFDEVSENLKKALFENKMLNEGFSIIK